VVDWDTIRELALALPEASETGGEKPSYRVRGKSFAWMSRPQDGSTLGVRVDRDEKHLLLESRPDLYFVTAHYNGYPAVLVQLDAIDIEELRERLEDAWLIQAPRKLAKEFLAASEDA
jgi:hypothetical protein